MLIWLYIAQAVLQSWSTSKQAFQLLYLPFWEAYFVLESFQILQTSLEFHLALIRLLSLDFCLPLAHPPVPQNLPVHLYHLVSVAIGYIVVLSVLCSALVVDFIKATSRNRL